MLDEAFLVAMAFLLPPTDIVIALAVGMGAGLATRRRPAIRIAFNVGQTTVAAALGVGAMHLLAPPQGPVTLSTALAALAGAAVFFLVQTVAVSTVIAIVERRRLRAVLSADSTARLRVLAGNSSVGLLAGLAGHSYPWALTLALIPIAVLQLAYAGHLRSRKDRQRLDGLLRAMVQAQSGIATGTVEDLVCDHARGLLDCESSRFAGRPAATDELGARLPDVEGVPPRWLVVRDRRGFEPFDDADQRLLDAIVALTATALETARLYRATEDERRELAEVIASSSDGIYSVGPTGAVASWNPAMERITGLTADDAVSRSVHSVLRPRRADGSEFGMVHDPVGGGVGVQPIPLEITAATGELRWVTCTFSPLPNRGYVAVVRDITAERRVDVLESAISTVSHELRSPITPIKGFAETLLTAEDQLSRAERRDVYSRMLRQSQQLERLVGDLWETAIEQRGEAVYAIERVDWAPAVLDVVESFRARLPDRQIAFDSEPALPLVVVDAHRAVQVLSNLLDNAAKYAPGGPIRVSLRKAGDTVVTTVADEGPGIPEAEREHIFEQYSRLERPSGSARGLGLGLHLARRLVDGMGGRLTVGPSAWGGSAFCFTLPTVISVDVQASRSGVRETKASFVRLH